MFGFLFASRSPWWDEDPTVLERNLRVEEAIEREKYGGLLSGGGKRPKGDFDVSGFITALMKFGVLPGIAVWLIYLGVTEYRVVAARSLQIIELHHAETSQRMDRLDRAQDRIVNLLRAQCVNAAKNRQEREDCLRAGQ